MFVNPTHVKSLRLHANERKCDGLLCHSTYFCNTLMQGHEYEPKIKLSRVSWKSGQNLLSRINTKNA